MIAIAIPKGYELRRISYNGHKYKKAHKFQAVNTPDGLIIQFYRHIEGCRHDWTRYTRGGLDDHFYQIICINGAHYFLFGDNGNNRLWFMEVPFQGSNRIPIIFNSTKPCI